MEDAKKYVVVGISRIKRLGDVIYYEGTDEATKQQFGGAYVWQKNVETFYPDEGFRIPYHRYMDQPDVLEKITLIPENSRCFKYGSRHISDDDALSLVEQFIEIVTTLQDMGDNSENWGVRLQWLNKLIAELWKSRGLFPGLPTVMDIIGLAGVIKPFKNSANENQEQDFRNAVFQWLNAERDDIPGVPLVEAEIVKIRRQWNLKTDEERLILTELLPRVDLPKDQMMQILSEKRNEKWPGGKSW